MQREIADDQIEGLGGEGKMFLVSQDGKDFER